jgi:hypothetical protein
VNFKALVYERFFYFHLGNRFKFEHVRFRGVRVRVLISFGSEMSVKKEAKKSRDIYA